MTYSIVAQDSSTLELGVAVHSHFFGVGRVVPWAEAGVGAVATQSFAEASYGPLGLDLMRAGKTADLALAELVAADDAAASRQVAFVDAQGRVAAHTGSGCVAEAGSSSGDRVSAQGNMLTNDRVWPAMLNAFESARGDLADRLLSALEAAEAAGGDIRGVQSAALLVVAGERSDRPWEGVVVDVRVDDHADPLPELRRLAALNGFYTRLLALLKQPGLFAGTLAASGPEVEAALAELDAGRSLLGGNPEATVWTAVLLARAGRLDEGRALLADVVAVSPGFAEFVRRLAAAGVLEPELARALAGGPDLPPTEGDEHA